MESRKTKGSTALAMCSMDFSSGRRLGLEIRMHDRALAGQQRAFDDLVVPVDRKLLFFLVDHGVQEGEQVLGVERGSGSRQASRHVEMADDLDRTHLRHLARL